MNFDIVKTKIFFPKLSCVVKNKREFVDLLMERMKKNGDIKYAGYLEEKNLYKDLLRHIGNVNIALYRSPSVEQKQVIEKTIYTAAKKCQKNLPHPDLPIFVFVYPWFPETDSSVLFGGVMAFAAYRTMHLFIDLNVYTETSLKQTVAHEWNHLVFYWHHPERQHSLREHIIMEGFAEVFREEVMGGKPALWSLALTKKEARRQLELLKQKLGVKGVEAYKEIFFGSKKYKRWTGYSIGYRLVRKFREKHHKLSWEEIIKVRPEDILLDNSILR